MLDYLLLTLIGCLIGVITGLTPGLHVNTVTLIGLSMFPVLGLTPLQFAAIMIAVSITQNFLDFIPAIFVGVPEERTALSILPTHKLLLQGKALEAVKLTAYGSLLGVAFSLLLLVPALFIIPIIYESIRGFVVWVVLIAVLFLILREKTQEKIMWSVAVFLLSGYFGLTIFKLKIVSSTQVLFPAFAGLFGLSTIIFSLKEKTTKIPQDRFAPFQFDRKLLFSGFLGSLGGVIVGVLPSMSPSQIGIIMSEIFGGSVRNFLVSLSAINTSDAIYSLVSLYTINNPRSGVATMLGKIITINFSTLMLFTGVIAFSAAIATFLHLKTGKLAIAFVDKINYRLLCMASLVLVLFLIYVFNGIFGILLSMLAMSIGMLPILTGTSRTHAMGILVVPTVFYFLGL